MRGGSGPGSVAPGGVVVSGEVVSGEVVGAGSALGSVVVVVVGSSAAAGLAVNADQEAMDAIRANRATTTWRSGRRRTATVSSIGTLARAVDVSERASLSRFAQLGKVGVRWGDSGLDVIAAQSICDLRAAAPPRSPNRRFVQTR